MYYRILNLQKITFKKYITQLSSHAGVISYRNMTLQTNLTENLIINWLLIAGSTVC